jgi:glycerol-3-phosphate dehydrogenase
LRIGLVEQHDLAFGTSSRSSRLLHGGLRYLAQGHLGLVREASREKLILHRIAPHLAEPFPFVFPAYRRSRWSLGKLRIGVKLYDWLCGRHNLGPSSFIRRDDLLEHLPGINPNNLTGAVRYFDALTSDARLVLDTLRAASRHGAVVCNYTRLEEASRRPTGWDCRVRDMIAERTYPVAARAVVNATGPWAPLLPQSRVRLRLTKGVHLVIDRERLPVADAVVMTQGRRILFAIPWGERVVLGTTDTDYDGLIEAVETEPADVDAILQTVNATFPEARLTHEQVMSTWVGLRPLIASRRGAPSDISRAHQIRMSQPGWFDVAGGKLTTYRLIGQQVVDRLLGSLGRPVRPSRTAEEPLLGPDETKGVSGILPPAVDSATVATVVEHYCRSEWAVHLDDIMLRRTGWHHYVARPEEVARQTVEQMARIFGWDSSRQQHELAR